MKLFTKTQRAKLMRNAQAQDGTRDFVPVVKLFTPWGGATWLLSELDEHGVAFGLCDLGLGSPELGYVAIDDIEAIRGPFGLRVERERYTTLDKPLTEYADEARREGRICA